MGILLVYDVTDEKSFNSKSYGCRICQMQLLDGWAAIHAAVKEMRVTESRLTLCRHTDMVFERRAARFWRSQ